MARDSVSPADEMLAAQPPPRPDDDTVRAAVRALRAEGRLLLGVLDDDPTGSQAVHDVQVVTVADETVYGAALDGQRNVFRTVVVTVELIRSPVGSLKMLTLKLRAL